MNIHLHRLY